ncbi:MULTISPECIES: hypothetical protein [unclassified Serratia (in: enterobacteria)]|uniref:hypothetical protein n=1 Tax=unclassified Serratia (in: enterobacteria) TaxID=2647522 RepID=UPI0005010EC2|nr:MULTISPECIES: hypothetical protein [unclassified Serratia (in: enterobacteria)]KFK97750.1 hypothetical protein JV45_00195 [Serratia sp. Ag2]KFL00141.1 hypothetical protein IV04_01505 [Serratia sp. Ag1]
MQHVPADAQQADEHPVPLDNEPGSRSISDDDLCAWCSHLCYRPGEVSLCQLIEEDGDWPACFDSGGYAQSCTELHLIVPTMPQNS